ECAVQVASLPRGGGPRAWLAKQVFWAGDLGGARAQFGAALATDRRSGNELERPYRLYDLALVECAAGNLASAAEIVDQGLEAAGDAENADAAGWLFLRLAMIQAWRGLSEAARASAGLLLTQVRRARLRWIVRGKSVLGLLALSEVPRRARRGGSRTRCACSSRWASRTPERCRSCPTRSRPSQARVTPSSPRRSGNGSSGSTLRSTVPGRRRRSHVPTARCWSPGATRRQPSRCSRRAFRPS